MSTFRSALTALAALSVTGVTNYDIDTIPERIHRAQLPALLVLPGEVDDGRVFRDEGEGFITVAFSSGPRTLSVAVTHLLLFAPVAAGAGDRTHLPGLIDAVDVYFTALGADVTLGDVLEEPAAVTVQPGRFDYADVTYHGCAFRHTWKLEVAGT